MSAISAAASAASAAPITKSESADNALEFLQTEAILPKALKSSKIERLGRLPTDLIRKIVYYAPGSVTVSSCFFRGLFLDDNPKAYHKLIQIAGLPWEKAIKMNLPDIKSPPPQDEENFFGRYLSIKLAKAFGRSMADGVEYFNGLPENYKGLISVFYINYLRNIGNIQQIQTILKRCTGLKEIILITGFNKPLLQVVPESVYANLRRLTVRNNFSNFCTEGDLINLLENCHQLEYLELVGVSITDEFCKGVQKYPVRHLIVTFCLLDGTNLGGLLVKFPQLEHLEVSFLNESLPGEEQPFKIIPEKTCLNKLALYGSQHFTGQELISLIRSCSDTLSHLELFGLQKITDSDLREALKKCHNLESLSLSNLTSLGTSEGCFDVVPENAPINNLSLQMDPSSNIESDEILVSIGRLLAKCRQLSRIDLRNFSFKTLNFADILKNPHLRKLYLTGIKSLDIRALVELTQKYPNLEELSLLDMEVILTNEFCETMPGNPHLRKLKLSMIKGLDIGALVELTQKYPNLEELSLLGIEGVLTNEFCETMLENPHLRKLKLIRMRDLNIKALVELIRKYPNLEELSLLGMEVILTNEFCETMPEKSHLYFDDLKTWNESGEILRTPSVIISDEQKRILSGKKVKLVR